MRDDGNRGSQKILDVIYGRPLSRALVNHIKIYFLFKDDLLEALITLLQIFYSQYRSLLHIFGGWGGEECMCVKAIPWTACCFQKYVVIKFARAT
jgi:hypothetical protein